MDRNAIFMRMKEDAMNNGQTKSGYNDQIATENRRRQPHSQRAQDMVRELLTSDHWMMYCSNRFIEPEAVFGEITASGVFS